MRLLGFVCLLAAILRPCWGQTTRTVLLVRVPATANPYLAGMPPGTKSTHGDMTPEESPVLVDTSLANAITVSFRAAGAVEHAPYNPPQFASPNGAEITAHQNGAEHGMSDINAPMNSLLGVFLDDRRPDKSRTPRPLKVRTGSKGQITVSPALKQIFFIGAGATKGGVTRKYEIPKGATRLFLAVMDGYEWNNNQGAFGVEVTIERTEVTSNMFSVESSITFADWACLPDRNQCTPERPVVKETGPGQYHVLLPAQIEWGASVAAPATATVMMYGAGGMVCMDSQAKTPDNCMGPEGGRSGIGALVMKRTGDRAYFSVRDPNQAFDRHEGYFEFEVQVK